MQDINPTPETPDATKAEAPAQQTIEAHPAPEVPDTAATPPEAAPVDTMPSLEEIGRASCRERV